MVKMATIGVEEWGSCKVRIPQCFTGAVRAVGDRYAVRAWVATCVAEQEACRGKDVERVVSPGLLAHFRDSDPGDGEPASWEEVADILSRLTYRMDGRDYWMYKSVTMRQDTLCFRFAEEAEAVMAMAAAVQGEEDRGRDRQEAKLLRFPSPGNGEGGRKL